MEPTNFYHKRYNKPVVIFDIDGVMNNYPKCWIEFINNKIGTKFTDLNEVKNNVSYATYKSLKQEYRQSGYKLESIEANPEVSKVLNVLKQKYLIVIITARPVDRHPSLFDQTAKWLNKNNIPFEDIIFSTRKQLEVVGRYPQAKFIVEDNGHTANLMTRYGYKSYLVSNEYNKDSNMRDEVIRIKDLTEIEEYSQLVGDLAETEDRQQSIDSINEDYYNG